MIEQKKSTTLEDWWETLEKIDKEREQERLENEKRKTIYHNGVSFTTHLKSFR